MSLLEVRGLTAGYGGRQGVRSASFAAEAGELTGLLGANGSGKTTLLKALCGILPHAGSCFVAGQRLEGLGPRQLARVCGYIPQRSGIGVDLTAREVVLMGFNPRLGLLERPGAAMRAEADRALAAAGLAGREEENYQTFSEGEKQLCILARALAGGGRLLLLDEPESALDFRRRYRALALLAERGFDPAYGARPLRRQIINLLEDPAADAILSGAAGPGDRLVARAAGDGLQLVKPDPDAFSPAGS